MSRIKQFLTSPKVSLTVFLLANILLLSSSIGGARAALAYYSENYTSRMETDNIGVTLVENDTPVAWRNFGNPSKNRWNQVNTENRGILLGNMLEEDESFIVGKPYEERLYVSNTGAIGEYVRVTIYRYWLDEDGNKTKAAQEMSPDWIHLNLVNTDKWLEDTEAATAERTVLYYNQVLASGASSVLFADRFFVDNEIALQVTQEQADGGKEITVTYDYDNTSFCLEVVIDAVQEHNGEDAIRSAWGRDVTIRGGMLSL